MAEQAEEPVDAIIFFDANMPKMAACREDCDSNGSILCKHRFNFASLMSNRGDLTGLSDWEVTQRFLDLIDASNWLAQKPKPIFVIVTKDHNFIDDLKMDYFNERQDCKTFCVLEFHRDMIIRKKPNSEIEIFMIWIKHRASGDDKETDLRSAIDLLNKLFAQKPNP